MDDPETIAWIRSLAVPPAWTDVWISPHRNGHVLATGRDSRGRKQYRYHPAFRARREGAKFDHLVAFGRSLPRIRRQVDRDLRRRGTPREKIVALVVALLDRTAIRIGNEAYARDNRSFGLTTLKGGHASVRGSSVLFRFRGKSGRIHQVDVRDSRLARLVRRCKDLPGQHLFTYETADGEVGSVSSEDVNAYLRACAGPAVSAKDFRTWVGSVLALDALRTAAEAPAAAQPEARGLGQAVDAVARALGNTPAVARRSYVHPAITAWHGAGTPPVSPGGPRGRLSPAERELLGLLATAGSSARSRRESNARPSRAPGTSL